MGVQIGKRNRQHNIYRWKVKMAPVDLGKRLDRHDVQTEVKALSADPSDRRARTRLLRKIGPSDWSLGAPANEIHVAHVAASDDGSISPLTGTMLVREVRGVQVGDDNSRRNDFTHVVTPTSDATALLKKDRKLAKALLNEAFPRDSNLDTTDLDAALQRTVEDSKIVSHDGVKRSVHIDLPGPGETLKIDNHLGVCVGPEPRIERTDIIDASRLHVRSRRLPTLSDLSIEIDHTPGPSTPRRDDGWSIGSPGGGMGI